ncbi:hypothetical protein PWT90_05657 [Aphanocladium album]|nr:hypothetical protein PWT90_05657 [Aphanocladium album]
MQRVASKVHHSIHRQHETKRPRTIERTAWALVDKAALEATLNKITTLVGRLNSDFAPVDQRQQLNQSYEIFKELKLSDEELRQLGAEAGDRISRTVVTMLQGEQATGNRFVGIKVAEDGTVNIGDYYEESWKGQAQRQAHRNDTFEELSVTGAAFVNIGDSFGGKSPMQMRLEQWEGAKRAVSGGSAS